MDRPAQTWDLPSRHIGRLVLVFDSLPSTNDFAVQHHDELLPGTVVFARAQTSGRGNYGRTWLSPAGAGVWMSIVVRPPEFMKPVMAMAWVSVSVAETIHQLIQQSPQLKWPNDVLLRGRKVAGILIEQKQSMIVGIGLNVNQSATQLLASGLSNATSLAIVAEREFAIDDIARAVIRRLDLEYDTLLAGAVTVLESRWSSWMDLLDRPVNVESHDQRRLTGRLVDMSFSGFRLETESGIENIGPEMVRQISETPIA